MAANSSKIIVKNTIVLYMRMAVILLITLYSSRIILQALGIDDYGLYNVVGGVVLMLAFLKSSLTSSTQRFLSYEMGRDEGNRLQRVFSICLSAHLLITIVILLLAETIGLWFLNKYIQIPDGREAAANWVYQFSVVSLALSMITVPYHACVISHERMTFFACVSIVDAVLKLAFAFAIMLFSNDRLILFGGLMMLTSVINLFLYWWYSKKHFPEASYIRFWDSEMFKEIFSFSGWTIWGQLAVVGSAQGKNILVNMFHALAANAAMGVAHQVSSAMVSLTSNFQMAFQPQLTKSYASGDYKYMNSLIYNASKVSYFLLFIVSLPVLININLVLGIWLTEVPQYSGIFCILYVIAAIFNALATPLWISIFATGNIRNYQIALSIAYFTEIVVIYILFTMGFPPTTAMVVKVFLNAFMVFLRLLFTKIEVKTFSVWDYCKKVLLPLVASTLLTLAFAFLLYQMADNLWQQLFVTLIIIIVSVISAYYVGLSTSERHVIQKMILKRLKIN